MGHAHDPIHHHRDCSVSGAYLLAAGCGGGAPAGGNTAGTARPAVTTARPAASGGAGGHDGVAGGTTSSSRVRARAGARRGAGAGGRGGTAGGRRWRRGGRGGTARRHGGRSGRGAGRGGTHGWPRRHARQWRRDGTGGATAGTPTIFYLDVGGAVMTAAAENPMPATLVASAGQGPDGIAVDLAAGHIFWTGMGNPSADDGFVRRSNLDGSNVVTLVPAGGTYTPKQMRVDPPGGKLYWSDREGMRVSARTSTAAASRRW